MAAQTMARRIHRIQVCMPPSNQVHPRRAARHVFESQQATTNIADGFGLGTC